MGGFDSVIAQDPGEVFVAAAETAAGLAVVLNAPENTSSPPFLRLTLG
ncbi:hypothetical protein [Streptomyces sp. NBC_01235]|nr:hypothetical protein OG289_16740 [Streptomyces sp. NBC_01235]